MTKKKKKKKKNLALDENGIRYLISLRLHLHLSYSTSPQMPLTIGYNEIIWALHSESQDLLFEKCMAGIGNQNQLTWSHVRCNLTFDFFEVYLFLNLYSLALGIGWWLKNIETLKRVIETIARNIYNKDEDKDPVPTSLYFMALNKKNVFFFSIHFLSKERKINK